MNKFLLAFALFLGFFLGSLSFASAQESSGATPAWVRGSQDAKVKIEVFEDLQCPYCRDYEAVLSEVERKYKGKVAIIYRHNPLQMHRNAMTAAQAAEAAGRRGKFWQMIEVLFDKQQEWSKSKQPEKLFVRYARRIGLNQKRFRADMNSKTVKRRIELDKKRAASLDVLATPTVFLNGERLGATQTDAANLSSLIKEKLKN